MMADLDRRVAIVTGRKGNRRGLRPGAVGPLAPPSSSLTSMRRRRALSPSRSATAADAEALCADVTAVDQVEEMVERCLADFGALHITVNNAGIHGDPANPPVADYPLEWCHRVLATNLSSVLLLHAGRDPHDARLRPGRLSDQHGIDLWAGRGSRPSRIRRRKAWRRWTDQGGRA